MGRMIHETSRSVSDARGMGALVAVLTLAALAAQGIAQATDDAAEGPRSSLSQDPADPEGFRVGYGNHHMGTTRMSADPRQGVVDADCRVHGLRNLYVAGSSVFPTSGAANPTLTLVALAWRLAHHLEGALS